MNVRRAVEIAIQIADALSDAHAHGFGHGGLSPDSVVISAKGRAKIPAFELASQSGFDKNGNDGRLIDYESPEEARGESPDDRSDVYSVGAILYETLTTRRPMHRGASAPSAVAFAGVLRGSIAVLDALGVAGEEEELAQTQSTSMGRVVLLAGGMLVVVAALAWWLLR
jgi:serine/threonine protein kinase